jgi:DNA-binding transcriptional LysR family regulator
MLERLNLNQLRIFAVVYRHRNMTRASKELHLTQSGVSQHIKALESALGQRLFDRHHQQIIPTASAHALYEGCARGMGELEQALYRISGQKPSGFVRIGCPPEFGYNRLLPLMDEFQKKYPEIIFRLTVGYASEMNESLLRGELDFAFVDDFSMDTRIDCQPVYNEAIELCFSPQLKKRFGKPRHTLDYYRALPYIAYFEQEPVLRRWFQHHLGTRDLQINVRAYLSDCQSVSRMVLAGVGAGVLPNYSIEGWVRQGYALEKLKGSGQPLVNRISLAHLASRTLSVAASESMHFFAQSLKSPPWNLPIRTVKKSPQLRSGKR